MCHSLSENLIKWCEKTSVIDENHYIKAVYGMEVFLENIWKLIGFLLIGIWVENKVSFFVAIASFSLLRILAGGRHFKSSLLCFGFVTLVGLFPAYVLGDMEISTQIVWLLYMVIFSLLYIYAPCMSVAVNKSRKKYAFVLAFIYLVLCLAMTNVLVKNAILAGSFIEALTLIKGGKGNEKRANK